MKTIKKLEINLEEFQEKLAEYELIVDSSEQGNYSEILIQCNLLTVRVSVFWRCLLILG